MGANEPHSHHFLAKFIIARLLLDRISDNLIPNIVVQDISIYIQIRYHISLVWLKYINKQHKIKCIFYTLIKTIIN